jgi:hypothetical protein
VCLKAFDFFVYGKNKSIKAELHKLFCQITNKILQVFKSLTIANTQNLNSIISAQHYPMHQPYKIARLRQTRPYICIPWTSQSTSPQTNQVGCLQNHPKCANRTEEIQIGPNSNINVDIFSPLKTSIRLFDPDNNLYVLP